MTVLLNRLMRTTILSEPCVPSLWGLNAFVFGGTQNRPQAINSQLKTMVKTMSASFFPANNAKGTNLIQVFAFSLHNIYHRKLQYTANWYRYRLLQDKLQAPTFNKTAVTHARHLTLSGSDTTTGEPCNKVVFVLSHQIATKVANLAKITSLLPMSQLITLFVCRHTVTYNRNTYVNNKT